MAVAAAVATPTVFAIISVLLRNWRCSSTIEDTDVVDSRPLDDMEIKRQTDWSTLLEWLASLDFRLAPRSYVTPGQNADVQIMFYSFIIPDWLQRLCHFAPFEARK